MKKIKNNQNFKVSYIKKVFLKKILRIPLPVWEKLMNFWNILPWLSMPFFAK